MKLLKKILISILAVFGGLIVLCIIIGLCVPSSDTSADTTKQPEVTTEVETSEDAEISTEAPFNPNDAVASVDLICAGGDHKLTLYYMGNKPDSPLGAHFESVNDSANTYDVLVYVDPEDINSYYSEDKSINIWCDENLIYSVTNSSKDYWEFSAEYHLVDDENYDDTSNTVDDAGISEDYSEESDYYDEEGAGGDEEEPAFLDDSTGPDFFRDRNNIGNPVFISSCRVMMYDQSSDCMTATLSEGSNVILLLENVSCASSEIYYTGDFINVYGVYDGVSGSTPAIDLYSVELTQ